MLLWVEKVWVFPWTTPQKERMYDMFKTHLMDSIKMKLKEENTDVAIIRGGSKSQLQLLDVSINKPFKKKRILWSDWMAGSTDLALTRGG